MDVQLGRGKTVYGQQPTVRATAHQDGEKKSMWVEMTYVIPGPAREVHIRMGPEEASALGEALNSAVMNAALKIDSVIERCGPGNYYEQAFPSNPKD